MKTIIVPKKNTPPFSETIVIELTQKEARDMIDTYKGFYRTHGYKPLGYSKLITSIENFLSVTKFLDTGMEQTNGQ